MRHIVLVVALALSQLTAFLAPHGAKSAVSSGAPPACGRFDRPERGVQGDVPLIDQLSGRAAQGYNCGVALVGHSDLGGRGGNANMAWAGNCAYIAGTGTGIAVVDVSDPRRPRHVTTLHGPGSNFTLETLHALQVGDRAVLVAGRYGPIPLAIPAPMDIYDVRDCAHPKLRSTFQFPENIHNLTISPDGMRVYATLPLQVVEISDLAHPKFLGRLEDEIPQQALLGKYLGHEAWTSPDGNTLYLGGQLPLYDTFTIVDITGWPGRRARVLSQVKGRGHSIRLATINGRRYALHSEESIIDPLAKGCISQALNPFAGAAQPWLSDVTDPTRPRMRASQFQLEINEPKNCLRQIADRVNASVHYHDVDDPEETTIAMLSMWNAGLRIVDVRDPLHMREVGCFNPAAAKESGGTFRLDQTWGHVRYVPSTGHIWFATKSGGFWVVELEPQVRSALGLPAMAAVNPEGAPVRAPGAFDTVPVGVETAKYYCTLAA